MKLARRVNQQLHNASKMGSIVLILKSDNTKEVRGLYPDISLAKALAEGVMK